MTTIPVIEATSLGRRFGGRWALRDCTLSVPAGHVVGLVGPNGAGKSTLLRLAAGLLAPSAGSLRVLGGRPGGPEVLARVAFVAQDKPLYGRFTVADSLKMGGRLNPGWDDARARAHLDHLDIPLGQRCGSLSGGERAQVALALALGKRPDLLLLDEPVANLDPLARRKFLQVMLEAAAETDMTVVLSSHLLADLERCCDYILLLSAARVQLCGLTEDLLHTHRVLSGPAVKADAIAAAHAVVSASITDRQAVLIVRQNGPIVDPAWAVRPAALEELVLAYMSEPTAGAGPRLALAATSRDIG
jgi:ABC-2 type transport system ATP-binding protein